MDNLVNPMKVLFSSCYDYRLDHFFSYFILMCYVLQASQAWMEWLMKKRKAFSQRGDMAIGAWAEQQQRELNVRVRQLSRSKV